jgi:hypothetical protein
MDSYRSAQSDAADMLRASNDEKVFIVPVRGDQPPVLLFK